MTGRQEYDRQRTLDKYMIIIPDPGGQKLPTIIEKSEEISCFEILDVLFFKTFGHQNPASISGSACGSALS
jgi:hypothetical protein